MGSPAPVVDLFTMTFKTIGSMNHQRLRSFSFVVILPALAVILTSCSDDSPVATTNRQLEFTPAEQEWVDDIVESGPDITVMPMPSQRRPSSTDEGEEVVDDQPNGIAMVNLGMRATLDDDLSEALVELNRERPIGVVNLMTKNLRDADLGKLKDLDQVFHLSIAGEKVTDAGLSHVSKMSNVRELRMTGCSISDSGLAKLANMSDLHTLWITGSQVTGSGFAELEHLSKLTRVMANGCPITDEGVVSLANVQAIELLGLSHTKITDEGLMALTNLKNLQTVNVEFTKEITKAGAAAFKKARPKVQLIHGPHIAP